MIKCLESWQAVDQVAPIPLRSRIPLDSQCTFYSPLPTSDQVDCLHHRQQQALLSFRLYGFSIFKHNFTLLCKQQQTVQRDDYFVCVILELARTGSSRIWLTTVVTFLFHRESGSTVYSKKWHEKRVHGR
jgi:hypothetical protein